MSDLLDKLVEGERETMEPPAGSKKRTWKRVAGTVAIGGPLPVEPSVIAGPVTAAKSTLPWLKIVVGVVLGGAVAAGGYRVVTRDAPGAEDTRAHAGAPDDAASKSLPRGRSSAGAEAVTPAIEETPTPEAPGEDAVAPAADESTPIAPEATSVTPTSRSPTQGGGASESTSTSPATSTLAEETRLIARARAALRSGDPRASLRVLGEHQRRFSGGQLRAERMLLRAEALCESGDRAAGRAEAAALRAAFPKRPPVARVATACGESP